MINKIRIRIVGVLILVNFCNPCVFSQTSVKISPDKRQQTIEGWGASLCWWAHMVGQWEDEEAIDRIVDSITSPEGLNMNIFRYNIGGGDDPSHYTTDSKNGHMVRGKGLRAEMEGFKASATSPYNWKADAGQRKIMLKIKEKRPDAIFEAFSNSPPYWMTYSGCASGNTDAGRDNLKPEYYDQFCDYLVDVCKFYKDSFGIEFKTLEPFNESATSFWYANGSQEGCHFDVSSQIDIIKLLYPKLKDSGLNTIISASDETNLGVFINVLNGYKADGDVMDMIGQFNTHSYAGSDPERKIIKDMMGQLNKPFWQSETGPMGYPKDNPLLNNLQLTQKLIADVKIMKPDAWLDWQLFEEQNDVWCVFRGSFADETYRANKNFYVRMQFSRFIKQGYTIIESTDGNTLAAVNPANSELVLVAINTSGSPKNFRFDLSSFHSVSETTELYRTSSAEDCKKLSGPAVNDKSLSYIAPAYSASTFVVSAMYDN